MNTIKKYNIEGRYGVDTLQLTKVDNHTYKMKVLSDYMRVSILDESGETQNYQFIDPDGGPMVEIGCKLLGNDGKEMVYLGTVKSLTRYKGEPNIVVKMNEEEL